MKTTSILPQRVLALGAGALCAWSVTAQPVGQWDFNAGNLNATVGSALTFKDATTQSGSQFGTTTALGIPDIDGQPASVLKFPATADASGGLSMTVSSAANGGGGLVNDYSLVLDVLYPTESAGKLRAILESDEGGFDPDAEFWVTAANAFGAKSNAGGLVSAGEWHRLAIVVDGTAGRIRAYVDGSEVRSSSVPNLLDGRYALNPGGVASLFSDDTAETALGYVNSIQLRNVALTKGQVLALGGPTADGIPQVLPPVPSGIEKWIPAGSFASRTTPVGSVISVGSTTIQDSSITLKVDDVAVTSPTITRDGDLITVKSTPAVGFIPGTVHTVSVTYTDSLVGVRTLSHSFTAALFFEDFEDVTLLPRKDEDNEATGAFEKAWTHVPPAGWNVDNSEFIAVQITPDNPDDDADGFADNDGRTEWAGWSFANKDFWLAADNQRRSEFALSDGVVAIADPDEWDDVGHVESLFNSFLKTPEISLDGVAAGSLSLKFASSWRPEAFDDGQPKFPVDENGAFINNQTAIITASYDGAAPVQILKWDSKEGSPTFHADFPNEEVLIPLTNPAGAKKLVLSFEMRLGANDWWWAVDNIVLNAGSQPPTFTQEPADTTVVAGQPLVLTAVGSGLELSYQWYYGETLLTDQTAATLRIADITPAQAGNYKVIVSNAGGSLTSRTAVVTVLPKLADNTVLKQALWTYLPFDGNYTDASGSGNDAEAAGAPTFVAGKVGSGALAAITDSANGVFNYATLGTKIPLDATTDFSVAFWVKKNSSSGDPSLIANKDWDSGGNAGFVLFVDGSNVRLNYRVKDVDRRDVQGPAVLGTPEWRHVAATFNRDGDFNLYVDGSPAAKAVLGPLGTTFAEEGASLNIGQDGFGDYSPALNAEFDEVAIWGRELTVQEAAAVYQSGAKGESFLAVSTTPTLSFTTNATGDLVITYTGVLQSGTALGGTFAPVAGATSPYTVKPSDGPVASFFRSSN